METLIFFIAAVVIVILFFKFLTRIKKGLFVWKKLESNKVIFRTDFGTFTINGGTQKLHWQTPKGATFTHSFEEIKGIKYKYEETWAFLTEELVSYFDIIVFSDTYKNKNTTYLISLVLFQKGVKTDEKNKGFAFPEDPKIPIFVAQQLEIRDIVPIMPMVLNALSLHKDAGEYTRHVLDEILLKFDHLGKKLTLLV
jgi:hypothetical protein